MGDNTAKRFNELAARTLDNYMRNCWPSLSDTVDGTRPLTRGDRVRIKEGYYNDEGDKHYFYCGKNPENDGMVIVAYTPEGEPCRLLLADAIEPYPYTREERIERAIEDFEYALADEFPMASHTLMQRPETRAILFAILDAGV